MCVSLTLFSYDKLFYGLSDVECLLVKSRINVLVPELFFFNFSTPCTQNVNNTGIKYVTITKQTAF